MNLSRRPLHQFRRSLPRMLLVVLSTMLLSLQAASVYPLPWLDRLEQLAYDIRLRLTAPGGIEEQVVIIDLDERSLAAEGRWPWRRDKVARLFDLLFDAYGAAVVGVDVVFAEPDDSSATEVLDYLANSTLLADGELARLKQELQPQLDRDAVLAQALEERKVVLGYYFNTERRGEVSHMSGALPDPVFMADTFAGRDQLFLRADGYGANLEALQFAAWSGGHFNPLYDVDGVTRRIPTLIGFADAYYESLSLAVVRAYLGDPPIRPGFADSGVGGYASLEWLQVRDRYIPVDAQAAMLVPFRGNKGSFHYLSATDVLNKRISPDALRGRIVLIGTSAPGLLDLRVTPMDNAYPGVELHANAIAGMLRGHIQHRPAYAQGIEFSVLMVVGLFFVLLLPLLGPVGVAIASWAVLLTLTAANLYVWTQGMVIALAPLWVLVFLIFSVDVFYGYFFESRAKKKVADLFGQYVPAAMVAQLQENPELVSMEGESRLMTVLFSDVRGFTQVSEKLTARELAALMNAYMDRMTQAIHKYDGTIDKYIGDAIMAFWGAPLHDPDHARKALLGALEMQRMAVELRREFKARDWPELRLGIGLNTGEMNVGNMGSQFRRAYTVLGDAVNLGARLESISKQYAADIVVSESTKRENPDIAFIELDRIRVKGKEEPVTIYEPLGLVTALDAQQRRLQQLWQQMLDAYRWRDWQSAEQELVAMTELLAERPALTDLYLERIRQFRITPPAEDWDGVFTFTTK